MMIISMAKINNPIKEKKKKVNYTFYAKTLTEHLIHFFIKFRKNALFPKIDFVNCTFPTLG